jgi:hypothetical protein
MDKIHRPALADGGRFGESQFVGGRLKIVLEEDGVMTLAGGVDVAAIAERESVVVAWQPQQMV